jgi:enoyl-CoA hydratase
MARLIAAFPQACVRRVDRRSVYLQYGLPESEALEREWANSADVLKAEGVAGAARFAGGAGRHGDFGDFTKPRN